MSSFEFLECKFRETQETRSVYLSEVYSGDRDWQEEGLDERRA
jgi:hypothetical protein